MTRELSATLREIVRFHAVAGLFFGIVGFVGHGAIAAMLPAGMLPADTDGFTIAPTSADLLHIFGNNALFFALVSVLPLVNFIIFVPQFLSVGSHAHAIKDLPAATQFDLLYRHTALEILALLVAVMVSYRLLFAIRAYVTSPLPDRGELVAQLRSAAKAYPVILGLTLVGALLEGSVVVHF